VSKRWIWNERREKAAIMLAEGAVPDVEIAAAVGITRQSLLKWRAREEFRDRVAEIVKQRKDAALRYSIAQQDRRIAAMNDRWEKLQRVIAERAEELDGQAPGAGTGMLARQVKLSNTGVTVEEFVVDTGLLKELRGLEEQAAKELGQWIERKEHAGKDGGPIMIANARDELAARLAAYAERRRALSDVVEPDGSAST